MVRISYFVAIGRTAYGQLSSLADRHGERLYSRLADAFVGVMDVLQAMRGLSGQAVLEPLAALELWEDTGSRAALRCLGSTSPVLAVTGRSGWKN